MMCSQVQCLVGPLFCKLILFHQSFYCSGTNSTARGHVGDNWCNSMAYYKGLRLDKCLERFKIKFNQQGKDIHVSRTCVKRNTFIHYCFKSQLINNKTDVTSLNKIE